MKTLPPKSDRFSRFISAFFAAWWCLLLVISPAQGLAATLPNVPVNNPGADLTARDSQLESTLVLGPGNSLFSAYVDTGSWDGVPGGANDHLIGMSMSVDGGANWLDMGTLPDTIRGDGMNPALARGFGAGSLGDTIYLATTDFDAAGTGSSAVQIYRFLNNGIPFIGGVMTLGAGVPGARIQKPAIAVDNFNGLMLGQGNVYVAWSSLVAGANAIWFSRSDDGGNSYSAPIMVSVGAPGNVNGPAVVVGANHNVYVFWLEQTTAGVSANTIKVRRSTDAGVTFPVAPVTVVTMANNGTNGDLKLQSGFVGNSFPQAAANPILAQAGNLYVAYNDRPVLPAGIADKADVFLIQSANSGVTWAAPIRVNDDPVMPGSPQGTNDQFGPVLSITPDGTKLFVGFYDRRRDPTNYLIDTFGRIAGITAGTAAFPAPPAVGGASFRITTQSFPPVTDQDSGFLDPFLEDYYMGSADGAAADNTSFYYTWTDNRANHFFTGGRHDNQPDVLLAKIPVTGPGGILDLNTEFLPSGGVLISGGNGNGIIDFNECNNLSIILRNRGNADIVGISGVLENLGTPGVVVSQGSSLFPDVAAGATNISTMPFTIATQPGFVCGTVIQLRLTVTTFNAGTFVIPIRLKSGADGSPVTFPSLDTFPINIPDNANAVPSTVNVSGLSAPISSVKVRLWINHTRDSDLDIWLEGPDGTRVVLSSDNGGAGDDYGTGCATPTIFDDGAPTEVTLFPVAAANNFIGRVRPEQPLSTFIGKTGGAANGFWTLHVQDDEAGEVGKINCWSLEVGTATCTDGGGMCLAIAGTQVFGGNGNGRLDINECADLNVVLTNIRPVAFLGVSAKLISLTPEVSVLQSMSLYPDIPGTISMPLFRPTGTNLTPFKVSIPANFPCGKFVEFVLRVTAANDGTFDVPFRLQVGSCTPNPAYMAIAPQVPKDIPDNLAAGVNSTITIPPGTIVAPIGKVTVSVGIAHGNVSQLVLTLTGPDGTSVVLANGTGGGGDNFGTFTTAIPPFTCLTPTTFDDAGAVSIQDGTAPFAGAFIPSGPVAPAYIGPPLFGAFSGKSGAAVNGVWTLNVKDTAAFETGTLVCWSLTICEPKQFSPIPGALPAVVADGGFNDIAIPVSGITGPISKVRVATRITHPNVEDLDLTLIAPDGTIVNLSSDNGGASDNYGFSPVLPTVFDDDAPTNVVAAPLVATSFAVGAYRPEEPLAAFAGKSGAAVNGVWRLRAVDDNVNAVGGLVNTFLIDIFTATCTDGGGTCPPVRTLTVNAINSGSGVNITVSPIDLGGQQSGPTDFTRTYGNGTTVDLVAPINAPNGNTFVRWVLDGVAQPAGAVTVSFVMGADRSASAVYAGPNQLSVTAPDAPGTTITVTPPPPGVVPFSRSYPAFTTVTLLAPGVAPNGYIFVRWKVDGVAQGLGVNPITVTMGTAHSAVAEYDSPTRTLRVESEDPNSGVFISPVTLDVNGDGPGTTTFFRQYLTGTTVSLTAPAVAPGGRLFKRWEVDGHNFPKGVQTISILMDTYHKAEAEYMSATVELDIDSEDPGSGVDITVLTPDVLGRTSGTTDFKREYNRNSSAILIAPPVAGGHLFKHWEVDGDDQPNGQRVLNVLMDDDIDVEAEYEGSVPSGGTSFALWFDGFNDQVRVTDSPSLHITGPITVEAWINRDIAGFAHTIVDKSGCIGEAPFVGGYTLSVNAANKLVFQTKDDCANFSTVIGNTSLLPGTWYHVAGIWSAGVLSVYVNGVLDNFVATPRNPKLGNTPLLIGASGNSVPSTVFAGFIDEIRVWSVARTPAQLTANLGGCLTGSQPGLSGYWRLNEDNTPIAHDSSIFGNNGSLVNNPLWVASSIACALPSPLPIVLPRPAPAPTTALRLTMSDDMTGHACRFTVTGDVGKMAIIEVSSDMKNWAPLVCCTNLTGSFEVSDPMNPGADKRFFRVRQEP